MNPVPLTFGFHYAAVKDISGALPEQLHFTVTVIAPSGWALLNVCVVFAVLYWDLHHICIQGASLPVTGLAS